MNEKTIKKELSKYDEEQVSVFISYLCQLRDAKKDNKPKNWWFAAVTDEQFITLYKKVAIDKPLFIDGDTITLQYKNGLMVSYNYQAYKNKVLIKYPETMFDHKVVYEGDTYDFENNSGKLTYFHKPKNPFNKPDKNIIGAFCVIKNSKGDCYETLDLEEIQKMRDVAKTDYIWEAWFNQMVLKSVIKRACKLHFKDVVLNMDLLDNEANNPDLVGFPIEVKEAIDLCENQDELGLCYDTYNGTVDDEKQFLELMTAKKNELKRNIKAA